MPSGKDGDAGFGAEIERLAALLPELCYAANRLLEDCTPQFSKKVGVALWALGGSTKSDDVGRYLTTSDLVGTFRDWFVVSPDSANSEVSKVKADLFGRQFIKVEGDRDHIHLTPKGEDAVREMHGIARAVVGQTVSGLSPDERRTLIDFAARMIATRKPPARETSPGIANKKEVG